MNVRVLFFGATADETGNRTVELALDENSQAKTAYEKILDRFPQLKKHRLLLAVNQEYVASDSQLNDGDELAIFTAVSGG
jgi:molybdopterin converting factor small subunit